MVQTKRGIYTSTGLVGPGIRLQDGTTLLLALRQPELAAYKGSNGMTVTASFDTEAHGTLLHVGVSFANRTPSWNELLAAWNAFSPTAMPMMVLPRLDRHINTHAHTLHLYDIPHAWSPYVGHWSMSAQRIDMRKKTHGPYSAQESVRLLSGNFRPGYTSVAAYRSQYYSLVHDAMLWIDSYGGVCLAPTPAAWNSGYHVG